MNLPSLFYRPEPPDFARVDLPSIRNRNLSVPWSVLPEKMFVMVDGWIKTPKEAVARWMVSALGGVFIDCRNLPFYLAKDFYLSGVDLKNPGKVYAWCESLKVEVGFQEREGILEGHYGINGRWYEKDEVSSLGKLTAKLMENGVFVSQLGTIVSGFDFDDRVVLVGDDIIWDSLNAPYKFFIDTLGKKSPEESSWMIYGGSGNASDYGEGFTFFSHGVSATFINGDKRTVGDCVMVALVECVVRAHEMGFLKIPLEEAYFLAANWADSVRITVDRLIALS